MKVALKYGRTKRTVCIADKTEVTMLAATPLRPLQDWGQALQQALRAPLGGLRLEDMQVPGSIAIAVPDPSRPVPFRAMLPMVLERLREAFPRLRPEDTTLVIGGGLHPLWQNPDSL